MLFSNFQVYSVVDEMFLAGEIRETSQTKVSNKMNQGQEKLKNCKKVHNSPEVHCHSGPFSWIYKLQTIIDSPKPF
jgi:hypothetical protein